MLTPVVTSIDNTKEEFIVIGTLTPSANYGTEGGDWPHGDQLNLAGLCPSSTVRKVEAWSIVPQGSAPVDDRYTFLPGTDATNGVLQIDVKGTEFTPGAAYSGAAPTNISGYKLAFRAHFQKFV